MARYVGVGIEGIGAYGTPVAPTDFLDVITETMKSNWTHEKITSQRARSYKKIVPLTSSVGGDIVCVGAFEDCGLMLKAFIGSVTTTGSTPTWTHTFPATSGTAGRAGISLTCEVERDDAGTPDGTLTTRYAGCKVVGFAMSCTREQSPQITWSLFGKAEAHGTSAGLTVPTFSPMLVTDLTLSFDATALDLAEMSLTCSWPVDEPHKIGATAMHKEPVDNGPMTVELEVVLADFANTTQLAKVGSETPVDVSIAISDGTKSMTINLNKVSLMDGSNNMQSTETVQQRLSGEAAYDAAATEAMQIVLLNGDETIPSPA